MDEETSEVLPSFYGDVDVENLPVPSNPDEFGRVLRTALWGETGLEREILSPTRESEVRKPACPKRTKLFKGIYKCCFSRNLKFSIWLPSKNLQTLNAHQGKKWYGTFSSFRIF